MHLLPRAGYAIVSETFEYVRSHGAYRFSVTAKIVADGGGGRPADAPVLVVQFPAPQTTFALASEYDADSSESATFAVDVVEIVCEVGRLLSDEELEWYRANNGRYNYALLRGEAVGGEQTLRHSWTVTSPRLHVPTRQPIAVANIPASTAVVIAGEHARLADARFTNRTRIDAALEQSETTFTRSTRPSNDLVEMTTGGGGGGGGGRREADCVIA